MTKLIWRIRMSSFVSHSQSSVTIPHVFSSPLPSLHRYVQRMCSVRRAATPQPKLARLQRYVLSLSPKALRLPTSRQRFGVRLSSAAFVFWSSWNYGAIGSIQSDRGQPHSKTLARFLIRLLDSHRREPRRAKLIIWKRGGLLLLSSALLCACSLFAELPSRPLSAGNRLTYLDENDPFYPGRDFPKLTTPQWVGETNVEAV